MTLDLTRAERYIRNRLDAGALTMADIARLTEAYQRMHGLVADGMPGPQTMAALRPQPVVRVAIAKCFPLEQLADGRRPQVTSGFRTAARPTHDGCDLFYRWQESDGPQKLGDGGATRDPKQPGQPRWFIPDVPARAAATGVVVLAGTSPTGDRVWIEHADGYQTGYFHLRTLTVSVGDVVALGHPLGEVGDNPADIDATHLHFEVSPVNRYAPVDPEIWLEGATYYAAP